jgi:hypothetical protein
MLQQVALPAVSPLPPAKATECRVYERSNCELKTSCQPAAPQEMKWPATIYNISRGGLGFKLRRRFERGTSLGIELPDKNSHESYVVYVKVVFVKAAEDGSWSLGCQFLSELSEDELLRLLSYSQPEGPSAASSDGEDQPQPQVLHNVRLQIDFPQGPSLRHHVKRLQLVSAWPYRAGQPLTLRLSGLDGSTRLQRFEVVGCIEQEDLRTLRIRPLEPAAAAELLQVLRR